mmetsp:Transcript_16447/g.40153  ORF Transcript_16447/g.40153 Transcript_16447/m.40153 type:complete len:304 (-) Transcript_16447:1661-2572(-)
MVISPGHLTISPPALADMESESLPPSMATPSSHMTSLRATAQSYMSAPSPGSLHAHIQLPSILMSSRAEHAAHTRLVSDSPTDMRALASGERRPLMGCSPMAVTPPVTFSPSGVTWLCAMTAQSERGVWRGPTHCCWAMRPVTERSTLLVRKRLEPTVTDESTILRGVATSPLKISANLAGSSLTSTTSLWLDTKVFCGILPRIFSSGRSTGMVSSSESCTTALPSPVTSPTQHQPERSRSHTAARTGRSLAATRTQLFSWYSAPQISRTDMVVSPTTTSRISNLPPAGSTISFNTLQLPPAP